MAGSAPRLPMMAPALAAVLLGLVGCASNTTRLEVRAEPASAMVFARTPDGQTIRPRGEPPTFRLRFQDPSQSVYTIVATPVGPQAEQFLETTFPVSESGLHASRQIRPHPSTRNAHVLTLPLQRKAYEDLPFVEVILDARRGGWTTLLTTRRAYDDVTERGGVAPQRVARLPELTGLRGMSMSPDGDRMVYAIAEAEGFSDGVEASESFGVRLPESNGDRTAARRAAARAVAADAPSEQNLVTRSNLRGIRLAGGGIEQITVDGFYDFDPSFTSDGQHILFASNRRNMNASDILRIRSTARAGGIQNIYTDPQGHWLVRPTQGADGTIAFNMIPAPRPGDRGEPRPPEIWTIGGPGRFPTQVTVGLQPAISPSGDKIAFIRNGNLWVCRADGIGETQLTTDADRIVQDHLAALPNDEARERFVRDELDRTFFAYSHPAWSPDGRFIVYTSMQGQDPTGRRQEDIWVMDADGGMREQLTTNPSTDRYPLVSPDGRNIYFLSNRGRAWAIWRIPAPEFMRAE